MTKRYYYTDTLKAIWMGKEFDIKYKTNGLFDLFGNGLTKPLGNGVIKPVSLHLDLVEDRNSVEIKFHNVNRIYIHPGCHEQLKPQVGDVVLKKIYDDKKLHHISVDWISCIDKDKKLYTKNFNVGRQWIGSSCELAIIRRNDKAFFTPEVEEYDPSTT